MLSSLLMPIGLLRPHYDNCIIKERQGIKKGEREEKRESKKNIIREYLNVTLALTT